MIGIVGASGELGTVLRKQLTDKNISYVGFSRTENDEDLISYESINALVVLIKKFKITDLIYMNNCYNSATPMNVIRANTLSGIELIEELRKDSPDLHFYFTNTTLDITSNLYAWSKNVFADYCRLFPDPCIRFHNIKLGYFYGENKIRKNFMNYCIEQILNDEVITMGPDKVTRNFIHVEDVCQNLISLIHYKETNDDNKKRYSEYLIDGSESYTLKDLINNLEQLIGRKAKININGRSNRTMEVIDIDPKSVAVLRKQTHTLKSGLKTYLEEKWW
jgi:nucleoside-diphosphate-sugar epimerase